MAEQSMPASYGAVDLSTSHAENDLEPKAGIDAELIAQLTEATFEDAMALSQTVPVVLFFYTQQSSLPVKRAVTVLEDTTRAYQGKIALRLADAQTTQNLLIALQVQTLPVAIALIGKRPIPLFEGLPSDTQLKSLFDQLLEAAPQVGVTGQIAVEAADLEKPMPAEHEAPRAAEESEDWELAIALWKKVLANNPADNEAKLALTRAEFELRQTQNANDPLSSADALFASGQESEAFELLLDRFVSAEDADEKDTVRARLVQLFGLATDKDAVKAARFKLSNLLF